MKFIFEGKSVIEVEHDKTTNKTKLLQTGINLDCFGELDKRKYLDNEDLPTKDGVKVLTNVFVQGLVGNIHSAHQKGFWNDAEHIRYIISELERGFVQSAETGKSTFEDIKKGIDVSHIIDLESAIQYFLPRFEGIETHASFISDEDDFATFCHSQMSGGIGMKIRNELGLWDPLSPMHKYFVAKYNDRVIHPDDMSDLIVRGIYKAMKAK